MDPRKVEQIHQAMQLAFHRLTVEYVTLMMRLGCKQVTLHHF